MLDFALDKSLWERVRNDDTYAQHRREIKELYSEAFKTEPRSHSVSDILNNDDKGLWRLQFDHLQSSALMALIYPDNEEYYNNLLKTVWAYLNEYTWAPLGHYSEQYYGKTPKDFDYGLIDIFAASIAFSLAEIKNLFRDRFPRLLIDRITYEIRRRAIEPYLTRKFFWESHNNNWTAVCAGAVGGVLIYEAPELFFENQERLHKSMECYLASYKDDGMSVEGVGYWEFGFGFFTSYALLEKEITRGEFDWFKIPKVREIAKFLQKTFLQRDVLVTFSDSSVQQRYFFGVHHMLRHALGEEIEALPPQLGHVAFNNTHFNFSLRSVIYYNTDCVGEGVKTNVTYSAKNSNYLIKRTGSYGFACKGGTNGESHNHIDVGSFILAVNNKQIICDVGAGPYEDGYHTDRRYTFFNPSSYAHNIPIIDGLGQSDRATDEVFVEYDENSRVAKMEISSPYRMEKLRGLQRRFVLEESKITLTDSFDLTGESDITERFLSLIEPEIKNGEIIIDGVKIKCDIQPKITKKELKHHSKDESYKVYLIDYSFNLSNGKFEIEIEIN